MASKRRTRSANAGMPVHVMIAFFLLVVELVYVFLAWSPYGDPNGALRPWYMFVRKNLTTFVVLGVLVLVVFTMMMPTLGVFAFIITLYRVAQLCCDEKDGGAVKESFGDGLRYGWGLYYPDHATQFDQGLLEREQDGSRAAYSAALGDVTDRYWMTKLADYENTHVYRPAAGLRRKIISMPKDSCNYGFNNWLTPQVLDAVYMKGPPNPGGACEFGCDPCSVAFAGSVFHQMHKPRPLYTTSTLAKEMDLS